MFGGKIGRSEGRDEGKERKKWGRSDSKRRYYDGWVKRKLRHRRIFRNYGKKEIERRGLGFWKIGREEGKTEKEGKN